MDNNNENQNTNSTENTYNGDNAAQNGQNLHPIQQPLGGMPINSNPYGAQSPFAYGNQPYQYFPTGMATASLILGILSILGSLFLYMPPLFLLPIIGIILGAVYKHKHYPVGRGRSTAGIVLSILSIVICIAFIVIIFMNIGQLMEYYREFMPEYYDQYLRQYEDVFRQYGLMN
jgi:hypothetical protein